jgi:hypothetical protein
MKTKEEILDHLSKTVYTHHARKSIMEWLVQHIKYISKKHIKFASHVYNRDGVRMTEGLSFEDFEEWLDPLTFHVSKKIQKLDDNINHPRITDAIKLMDDETAKELTSLFVHGWHVDGNKIIVHDFHVGDWVKYIPEPGESQTEVIEAMSHDSDGEMYLCLSNGQYVRPCYCVKYKVQGEERQQLIDKLNETE